MVINLDTHLPLLAADFSPPPIPFLHTPSHLPPLNATSALDLTLTEITKIMLLDWSSINKGNGLIDHSVTKLCASPTMLIPVDADVVPAALTITPAPSVVTFLMAPLSAPSETIFLIITKLDANAWEQALTNAGIFNEFNTILAGLRTGFLCGLENYSLACTAIPPNHYTSQDNENFIVTKYAEEIALGRISQGYDPVFLFSLVSHFRTAPLAVITRNGKRRVIVNHSFPKNKPCMDLDNLPQITSQKISIDPNQTSINTIINSKKF
jgi:hypothetical protein